MKISAPEFGSLANLLGVGHFRMAHAAPSHTLSQNVWVLELVTEGRLEVSVEGGAWQAIDRQNGVLYAPGTRYREKVPVAGRICCSTCVFFTLSTLPRFKTDKAFDASYFAVRDNENLLTSLAEQSLHHLGLSVAEEMLATACFFEIMAHLLRARREGQTLMVRRDYLGDDTLITRAHRYMRARLNEPLTLPQIAAATGLTVSGFAHAYKRQTGSSPMAALRQMRVEAAKSHLMRNRLTLAQIAAETGFADAFHLSRTFKQITGVSPRRFRQGLNESEAA